MTRHRQVTNDGIQNFSRQELPQLGIAMASKEPAEILIGLALGEIAAQKALEGIGYFGCGTAISDRPRSTLMQAKRAADAEVVGIDHAVVGL